jgi:flagellar assembly protein FliH
MRETTAAVGCGEKRVEVFQYPAHPDAPPLAAWNGWVEAEEVGAPEKQPHEQSKKAADSVERVEFEQRLGEETHRSFESGREKGRQEGRQAEREAQAAALGAAEERRKRQIAELVEKFAQARDRYLRAVEHEVVKLALAIAARILRREAQMDPLLLTGAVRVALGQLSGLTDVTLRVPAEELDLWTEAMALLPNLAVKPTVIAGEGMRLGDCEVETRMGTVDLGVRAQLSEIERGFFDRAGVNRAEPAARLGEPAGVEAESHS